VRLDVRRIGKATAGEQVIGNRTRVKVVKNKLAPPFREAEFDIRWGEGVDATGELIDWGLEAGVVSRSGAHLALGGVSLGQGRERARQTLLASGEVRAELERLLGEGERGPGPAKAA
jgi:recombination protein RecA